VSPRGPRVGEKPGIYDVFNQTDDANWRICPIGETGRYINGVAFKPSDWGDEGFPIIRIQNLTDPGRPMNRTTREVDPIYVVQPGDLLVSWSATLDAFIWDREPALLNQHIFKVVPNTDLVSKQFLFHSLRRAIREMLKSEHLHGSTMKHINRGPFLAHGIPVPPLARQAKIVAELETQFSRLDEGVANLTRVKANLKRHEATLLKAAVEGRLVPTEAALARTQNRSCESGSELLQRILNIRRALWNGKGEYREPKVPDTASLPNLPDGWTWARLDAVAQIKGGITVDKQRRDSTSRSVPYLRVANVQRGYLDLEEIKMIDAPEGDIEALRLVPGDILFNEGGDRDKLGRGWIWEGQLSECIHQNHVFRARLLSAELSGKLISWWGNSFGKDYFLREGKQTTNLASINITNLSAFPIPIPPVAEQHRIAAEVERCLSIASELDVELETNLRRATSLRTSILDLLFSVEGQRPVAAFNRETA
jgi:type I restriction enzyme, S subunit